MPIYFLTYFVWTYWICKYHGCTPKLMSFDLVISVTFELIWFHSFIIVSILGWFPKSIIFIINWISGRLLKATIHGTVVSPTKLSLKQKNKFSSSQSNLKINHPTENISSFPGRRSWWKIGAVHPGVPPFPPHWPKSAIRIEYEFINPKNTAIRLKYELFNFRYRILLGLRSLWHFLAFFNCRSPLRSWLTILLRSVRSGVKPVSPIKPSKSGVTKTSNFFTSPAVICNIEAKFASSSNLICCLKYVLKPFNCFFLTESVHWTWVYWIH